MKSCADLFLFSDTSHISIAPSQEPPSSGPPAELSARAEADTDSNSSLYEATQKTLRLDGSADSSATGSMDIKMASPEKSGDEGEKSRQKAVEEGEVDVGGGEHLHKQR